MPSIFATLKSLLNKIPTSWVELTTHRLDVYNESLAKSEFLLELKKLCSQGDFSVADLEQLPTAYDYIRLGHPLSSLLEWALSEINAMQAKQVITFASHTMPVLAILRANALSGQATTIYYDGDDLPVIDEERLKNTYGFQYKLHKISDVSAIVAQQGTVVFVTQQDYKKPLPQSENTDITVNIHPSCGSAVFIHCADNNHFINSIQHVRRRETIAMTPYAALSVLKEMVEKDVEHSQIQQLQSKQDRTFKQIVDECIRANTGSRLPALVASSGLSIQYAILMGLIENGLTQFPKKAIKIILPPNCYGGTNDQCRRIAALLENVEIVDMLVDGGQDLVSSLDRALDTVAKFDALPLILAEIPTNPRVEVPDMQQLGEVLTRKRMTCNHELATTPFIMVDQTFCPNVQVVQHGSELHNVPTISFASASKFPSGGRCIGGYCAANTAAKGLLALIEKHLVLTDNHASVQQIQTIATHMPSMPVRIKQAYSNTQQLVKNIKQRLPQAKIYFVTDAMAQRGFMPSVFSLDLPATGQTKRQRSEKQRQLNKKLIEHMVKKHPKICKNCVSYGQLTGSYWTIPATSTQGTTKEEDKDYIVRVALAPDVDVELLSHSFAQFCRDNDF